MTTVRAAPTGSSGVRPSPVCQTEMSATDPPSVIVRVASLYRAESETTSAFPTMASKLRGRVYHRPSAITTASRAAGRRSRCHFAMGNTFFLYDLLEILQIGRMEGLLFLDGGRVQPAAWWAAMRIWASTGERGACSPAAMSFRETIPF